MRGPVNSGDANRERNVQGDVDDNEAQRQANPSKQWQGEQGAQYGGDRAGSPDREKGSSGMGNEADDSPGDQSGDVDAGEIRRAQPLFERSAPDHQAEH